MQRQCGCPEEKLAVRQQRLREFSAARININDDGSTINIDVIVHIMFETSNLDHFKTEAAYVVDELTKDFAKQASTFEAVGPYTNSDLQNTYADYISRAADANVVFTLKDVLYHPVPTQSTTNLTTLNSVIKGASPAISPQTTLNLWVADMTSGLLGYAQFPWELAAKPNTDGVVIARGTFGRCAYYQRFDNGKTLTHETGHWMGLYHTFQATFAYDGGNIDYMDGTAAQEVEEMKGDCVADTPPQGNPTSGNPLTTLNTWPTSSPTDETGSFRHMYMNFMDYSDDAAMMMFTHDQSIKMRLLTYMYRPLLVPGFTSGSSQTTTTAPAPIDPAPAPTDPVPASTDPVPAPTDPAPAPTDPVPAPTDPAPVPTDPVPAPTDPTPAPTDPAPAPTDPTPAPTDPAPAPNLIWSDGFELSDRHYWRIKTYAHRFDARIARRRGFDESRCLALRRKAYAEVKINMPDVENAKLIFEGRNIANGTYIQILNANRVWTKFNLPKIGNDFASISINLPKPYGGGYVIRFVSSKSHHYNYIDNLEIRE